MERHDPVLVCLDPKVTLDDSWDDVSPRFVVDYKVNPDVMVFGSLAKGYKAGGYNSVQPLSRFDNEDVWNVEAGVKSLFPEAGVIVNASAFYYVYYDRQAISLVIGDDGIGHYLVDTSDQEALGLDLDARWQPVDALTLSLGAEWIDATYKNKTTADGQDLSGEPTGEPYLSATLGASYVWTLGSAGKLDLSAQYAYRGKSRCNSESDLQGDCQVSPNFKVGETEERTDARLQWSSEDDRWAVAVFVMLVTPVGTVESIRTVTRRVRVAPAARLPMFQVTTPTAKLPPSDALTKVVLAGRVSVAVTPLASSAPALLIVTV
jgi:iron complex outermembrane receptor protein